MTFKTKDRTAFSKCGRKEMTRERGLKKLHHIFLIGNFREKTSSLRYFCFKISHCFLRIEKSSRSRYLFLYNKHHWLQNISFFCWKTVARGIPRKILGHHDHTRRIRVLTLNNSLILLVAFVQRQTTFLA